ncbi:MAG: GNAT family N-acetyltransferase [Eubacteriales bacterium]|nr:GNAT family N-acetyltransferase [Eubacteriales bacterium]
MAEIIYEYRGEPIAFGSANIRWLKKDELSLFNEHLLLCGQKPLPAEIWNKAYDEGTTYCLLMDEKEPIARACVERYSDSMWEVADVRVVRNRRNQGFAYAVSVFVLNYILENAKIPTIRTEADNDAMQRVIEKIGFCPCHESFS